MAVNNTLTPVNGEEKVKFGVMYGDPGTGYVRAE